MSNQHPDPGKNPKFDLLTKIQWLAEIAGESSLSRAELAICILLADKSDSQAVSYPSFAYIARKVGVTPRGAKIAIKRLLRFGIVRIHEKGNRVRSNRYKLNRDFKVVNHSSPPNSDQGSEPQFTRVVNHSSTCSEPQCHDVVNHSSPKSFHQASQRSEDGRIVSIETDADRGRGTPNGTPSRSSGEEFAEFWATGVRRVQVAEVNQYLAKIVSGGESLGEIVAGAGRWVDYTKATNSKNVSTPLAWLKNKKWLDEWTLPPSQQKKSGDPFDRFIQKAKEIDEVENEAYSKFIRHFESCDECECETWPAEHELENDLVELCETGERLAKQVLKPLRELEKLVAKQPQDFRDRWYDME